MGRHQDLFLEKTEVSKGTQAPMTNLKYGGQHGHSMDIGNYISNASYVSKPVIAFLMEAPRGFQSMADSESLVQALKAIVELHSETIEGLDASVSVEYSDTPIGGSNEVQQDVINVMRERSTPSHTVTEKYGESVTNFLLNGWIYPLLGDPETKYPRIVYQDGVDVQDLLPDFVSATVLYVEPDPTGRKAQKAWLITNMKPSSSVEVLGNKDKRSGGETRQLSIEFTGIQQVGAGVLKLAQKKLDEANLSGANPYYRDAFIADSSADVNRAERGYTEDLAIEKGDQIS